MLRARLGWTNESLKEEGQGNQCPMRKARRQALPIPECKYLQAFTSEADSMEKKKCKQKIKLQSTLNENSDVYDDQWVGDSLTSNNDDYIRIWYQNCNGLIHKNDIRGFQFEIAAMADEGVNYFSFSETCLNTNKPGYSKKITGRI